MLHTLNLSAVPKVVLPDRFNNPFHYTPDPLCRMAAQQVMVAIGRHETWVTEFAKGKMLGVLIVSCPSEASSSDSSDLQNRLGYITAFSGNVSISDESGFFVPPVYDLSSPEQFYKNEEAQISAINAHISRLEHDEHRLSLQKQWTEKQNEANRVIADYQQSIQQAKQERTKRRELGCLSEIETQKMVAESQFQKAELKRIKSRFQTELKDIATQWAAADHEIAELKNERKSRSAQLQQQIFEHFTFLNAKGESKSLLSIFAATERRTPPAGAGECAAPRLLQYAYLHHLTPIAIAEFWYGASPKQELRKHGCYYPACKEKCVPILTFMLQGLNVPDLTVAPASISQPLPLTTVYEDDDLLIIDKPSGMLSVPGKNGEPSVYEVIRNKYPDATGPLLVHRLDMATSGLLLIAKNETVHYHLQQQFIHRTIKKQYLAWLEGTVCSDQGIISLPLRLNPDERPKQIVDTECGKTAITVYRVLKRTAQGTLVALHPLTGRTHQLRVHASHYLGLNAPIIGDALYGRSELLAPAARLMLHAQDIQFMHPTALQMMEVHSKTELKKQ